MLNFSQIFALSLRQAIGMVIGVIGRKVRQGLRERRDDDSSADFAVPHPGYMTSNGMGSLEIGAAKD